MDDVPRNWLAPKSAVDAGAPMPAQAAFEAPRGRVSDGPADIARAPVQPALPAMPDSLSAFQSWLMESPAIADHGARRLPPVGSGASGVMILTDMPELQDEAAGTLFSGPAGRLLDRMLAAVGIDRTSAYVAALSPSRPPGGVIDRASSDILTAIARHHVALAAPKRLFLLGQAASCAILGTEMVAARGKLHEIKAGEATVGVVASFHPRSLLQNPATKARAWADLLMLTGGDR